MSSRAHCLNATVSAQIRGASQGDVRRSSDRGEAEPHPADDQTGAPELMRKGLHRGIIHLRRLWRVSRRARAASAGFLPGVLVQNLVHKLARKMSMSMQTSESATHLPPLGGP